MDKSDYKTPMAKASKLRKDLFSALDTTENKELQFKKSKTTLQKGLQSINKSSSELDN